MGSKEGGSRLRLTLFFRGGFQGERMGAVAFDLISSVYLTSGMKAKHIFQVHIQQNSSSIWFHSQEGLQRDCKALCPVCRVSIYSV